MKNRLKKSVIFFLSSVHRRRRSVCQQIYFFFTTRYLGMSTKKFLLSFRNSNYSETDVSKVTSEKIKH